MRVQLVDCFERLHKFLLFAEHRHELLRHIEGLVGERNPFEFQLARNEETALKDIQVLFLFAADYASSGDG